MIENRGRHSLIRKSDRKNLGLDPSVGNRERAILLDDLVDGLSYGRSLRVGNLRIDFPHVHGAFPREISHK